MAYLALDRERVFTLQNELAVTFDVRTLEEPRTPDQELRAALFQNEVEHLLGNDVNLRFELLPLLQKPSSLELVIASGSIVQFDLEGTMRNSEFLKLTIERLHKSVRTLLTNTAIERRNFEQGFSALIARVSDKAVVTQTKDSNGWQTVETLTASGTGLFTARWDDRFIISNDSEHFHSQISGLVPHLSGIPSSPLNTPTDSTKDRKGAGLVIHCQITYPLARCRF